MNTKIENVMIDLAELCEGEDWSDWDMEEFAAKYKFAAAPEMRMGFEVDHEENVEGHFVVRIVLLTVGMVDAPVEAYLFARGRAETMAVAMERAACVAREKLDEYDPDAAPSFDDVDAICVAEGVAR